MRLLDLLHSPGFHAHGRAAAGGPSEGCGSDESVAYVGECGRRAAGARGEEGWVRTSKTAAPVWPKTRTGATRSA